MKRNQSKMKEFMGYYLMLPEVLRGYQYTKAADIYSFGIVMNEFLSEEIPYNDVSHNHILAVQICSEDTPKLLADLIMKCSEIYSQIKECEEIRKNKLKNRSDEIKSKNIQ